jgi:hypothetical protein
MRGSFTFAARMRQHMARVLGFGMASSIDVTGDPRIDLRTHSKPMVAGSYRSKWVVGLICALVLAMLAAAAVTIWTTREHELANSERGLSQLSLALAQHTERTVFSLDLILSGLQQQFAAQGFESEEEFRHGLASEEVHQLMRDKIQDAPHIDALTILDGDGNLVNFSRTWPVPEANFADRDYFHVIKANPQLTLYISEPVVSRSSGRATIYLGRPLAGPDGVPLGWVFGALITRYFEDFFARVAPNPGATISLFRRDGLLLARYPDSASLIGKSFGQQPIFTELLAKSDHGIVATSASVFDDEARILAPWVVDHYPLVINVTDLESNILAQWLKLARVIVLVTALGLLLAIGLGFALVRQYNLQAGLLRTEAKSVSLAIAEAEDFEAALMVVLRSVCGITDSAYAEAWIPDADGSELMLGPVWHIGLPSLVSCRRARGMSGARGKVGSRNGFAISIARSPAARAG